MLGVCLERSHLVYWVMKSPEEMQQNNEGRRSASSHMRAQNGLGLKGFLSGRGCEYITTDKKEGPDNGKL